MHMLHPTTGTGKSNPAPTFALPGETGSETADSGTFQNLLGLQLGADAPSESAPHEADSDAAIDGLEANSVSLAGKTGKSEPQPGKHLPAALPVLPSSVFAQHPGPILNAAPKAGQSEPVASGKPGRILSSGAPPAPAPETTPTPDTAPKSTPAITAKPTAEAGLSLGEPIKRPLSGKAPDNSVQAPSPSQSALKIPATPESGQPALAAIALPRGSEASPAKPLIGTLASLTAKAKRETEPTDKTAKNPPAIKLAVEAKVQSVSLPPAHQLQIASPTVSATPGDTSIAAHPLAAKPSALRPSSSDDAPASAPASGTPRSDADFAETPKARQKPRAASASPAPATIETARAAIAEPSAMPAIADAKPISAAPSLQSAQPTPPSAPSAPQDFTTLVDKLVEAREQASPQTVRTALRHSDFGLVNLQFRTNEARLNVTMASADPDFAPAVQAASVVAQAQASASAENGQQQSSARHDGQNQQQHQIASGSGQSGTQNQSQAQSQAQTQSGQRDDPRGQQNETQTRAQSSEHRTAPNGTDTAHGDIFA